MNLTEQHKARTLAFVVPSNENPASGWKGYVLRITALTIGFGICVLLFKKKGWKVAVGRWGLRRNQETAIDSGGDLNTEIREFSDDRALVTYNGEVCPICFGPPKMGVKAPCGHLLCADCLANYCKIRIIPIPLPCPLCRAPLNSVTLAYDFVNTTHTATAMFADKKAVLDPKMLDTNTIIVRDWIREYNTRSRQVLLLMRLIPLLSISILFLIAAMIAMKFQVSYVATKALFLSPFSGRPIVYS